MDSYWNQAYGQPPLPPPPSSLSQHNYNARGGATRRKLPSGEYRRDSAPTTQMTRAQVELIVKETVGKILNDREYLKTTPLKLHKSKEEMELEAAQLEAKQSEKKALEAIEENRKLKRLVETLQRVHEVEKEEKEEEV